MVFHTEEQPYLIRKNVKNILNHQQAMKKITFYDEKDEMQTKVNIKF